jgi:hypothetical protein
MNNKQTQHVLCQEVGHGLPMGMHMYICIYVYIYMYICI